MPLLPLDTPRLRLRVLQPTDLDALVEYRNDPGTARFQYWDLPYTRERAEKEFAEQAGLDDIGSNGWTQVAVEVRDPALTAHAALAGDLAVGLEHDGAIATIGYTLAPAWRRRGLAREAVGALVDALFTHTPAHRIVASLDPLNTASERLLVDLGFQREGIARQAYPLRGEWVDDLIYSLVRSDRFGTGNS